MGNENTRLAGRPKWCTFEQLLPVADVGPTAWPILARRPKRCTALPNAPGRKRWYGHRERPPGPKAETGWSTDYPTISLDHDGSYPLPANPRFL